uniref:Rieske domain-containing protein n=1 Tax=Pyxicephalus adspersus TaxID=30357 RepID=A0AAV2ZXL9_PYXAD|nr:TPA: hypothetical protein GDO54_014224 [Pyxicephalus adspersus]
MQYSEQCCYPRPRMEVKVEVVLPEKDREKEELSPNGKASPLAYKANGTTRHYHHEERPIVLNPYTNPKDMVEASVCHVKDLENGQMREVDLGCGKALLIKQNGEYYAMGHKCPHYGAPLVKGVLSRGRVRCPWHGACFNIATGDIEDFPGLDGLPKFQVKIEKERVYIRASKQALQSQRRTKVMAKCIALSNYSTAITNILIIGAGPAGLVCAETLRQEGFSDRIVMCTSEKYLPYDRSKLSKSMDSQAEQILLRSKEFFHMYDIEVLTETQVINVDTKNKTVVFKDGFRMEYNKLLIATGSTPKTLTCKGKELDNVFTIRTPEDANRVVKLASNRNVVIVGASFLGKRCNCFFCLYLKEVVLKSGKVLRADACVIGIGRIAALNMLAQGTEINTIPYLWTAMFGKSIRYAGNGDGFDDVIIQGDIEELKFVAFYTRNDEVIAVASMNYDPIVSKVAEVMASGKSIRKRDVETGDVSWLTGKGS